MTMRSVTKKIISMLIVFGIIACSFVDSFVFASTVNFVVKKDNNRVLPTEYGTNILSGKGTYKVKGLSDTAKENITPSNRTGLTDGNESSIGKMWETNAVLFAKSGTPIVKYQDGSRYLDIIFRFNKSYDINAFCLVGHSNSNLAPSHYEIYASGEEKDLFLEESLVADVINTHMNLRQIVEFNNDSNPKQVRYIAFRILFPVSNGYSATYSYYYTRLAEVAAYGELSKQQPELFERGEYKTSSTTTDFNQLVQWDKDVIKGKVPKSVKYYKNGVTGTQYYSGNAATYQDRLTDGEIDKSWGYSELKFKELSENPTKDNYSFTADYTNQPDNYYVEVLYDVGKQIDMHGIYICNHIERSAQITKRYRIYASADSSIDSSDIIADYTNDDSAIEQFFVPNEGEQITARYFAVRIYDPCVNYNDTGILFENGVNNYSTAKLNEIAIFTDIDLDSKISFNSGYRAITENNNLYVGPFVKGTKAISVKNAFNGSGEIDLHDTSGNILDDGYAINGATNIKCYAALGEVTSAVIAVGGDFDYNGLISVSDILGIVDGIVNGDITESQVLSSDVNNDNRLSVTDIALTRRIILEDYSPAIDDTPLNKKIQKVGHATDGTRSVSVDVNNVTNHDFKGFGTNVFPSTLSNLGKEKSGYNNVYFELDKKRLKSASPNVARMWFQIDWMIKSDDTDGSKYKNGEYDFNNDYMQAVYDYTDALKEIGCEVEVNFGWKTADSIQSWFNAPLPSNDTLTRLGAPKDPDAFANASVAFLREMWSRGYDNVKFITFYNEPNSSNDFEIKTSYINSVLNKWYTDDAAAEAAYWSYLVKKCATAMENAGIRENIEIWGPELAYMNAHSGKEWFIHQVNNSSAFIDCWSGHSYYSLSDNFNLTFDLFKEYIDTYGFSQSGKGIMITEMYGGSDNSNSSYVWNNWNDSTSSYIIAASNVGIKGVLTWSLVGGWLPHMTNVLQEQYDCAWILPTSKDKTKDIKLKFYEESLLMNYIPNDSKVVHTTWSGSDIRASAYTFNDGNDITIIVEANGSDSVAFDGDDLLPKDISIRVNDAKFKKFNRFSFIRAEQVIDANCNINSCDKTIDVNNGYITDRYSGKYGLYIYTTLEPVKQISLENVTLSVYPGNSVQINPTAIDCGENYQFNYEVVATTNVKGLVSTSGVYYASTSAKTGDMDAVKVSLKSNPDVYTIALVYIS